MKSHSSTLTSKGQITIPSYIRNKLKLDTGSKLEFIIQDNSFIVMPITKSIKSLKGMLPKPKKAFNIDEMDHAIKGSYDSD